MMCGQLAICWEIKLDFKNIPFTKKKLMCWKNMKVKGYKVVTGKYGFS